jgi:prepilin-type N-terminal cleavage/methylation domain-containing protein/prepilin-type processing-associated H-X9-DG protein
MSTRRAFTLIELLVVISILVMLMAMLLPTVERARGEAKAVACLAKVRQWGLAFKMYTDSSGGRWFTHPITAYQQTPEGDWEGISGDWRTNAGGSTIRGIWYWAGLVSPFWSKTPAACPMAMKGSDWKSYDAFSAWFPKEWGSPIVTTSGQRLSGPISYEINRLIFWPPPQDPRSSISPKEFYWGTCDVRGAARIPVFFDSAHHSPCPLDYVAPPLFEGGIILPHDPIYNWPMCINRHDGGVNMLFMDWSVRKVGLKELWTFKWDRRFNTAGIWTKQGGVEAEDWPQWMRRFKDY